MEFSHKSGKPLHLLSLCGVLVYSLPLVSNLVLVHLTLSAILSLSAFHCEMVTGVTSKSSKRSEIIFYNE